MTTFRTGDAGCLLDEAGEGGIRELCYGSRGHLAVEGWTVGYRLVSWSRNYLCSMAAVCLGGHFAVVAIFLFRLTLVCLLLETEVIIILFDVLVVCFVACVFCVMLELFLLLAIWQGLWLAGCQSMLERHLIEGPSLESEWCLGSCCSQFFRVE